MEYLSLLAENGLIQYEEGTHTFRTTEKGIHFLSFTIKRRLIYETLGNKPRQSNKAENLKSLQKKDEIDWPVSIDAWFFISLTCGIMHSCGKKVQSMSI